MGGTEGTKMNEHICPLGDYCLWEGTEVTGQ